jgi:DNA-binding transcriptional ArsR family regulator
MPSSSPISLDLAFQALADPTRRSIVEQLMRGPRTVSALAEPFGMSLAAIGHHLRMLESGGLIRSQKRGRIRICRIEPKGVLAVERWVSARRADWERRLKGLDGWLTAAEQISAPPTRRTKSK